jgi:hypothetical protein
MGGVWFPATSSLATRPPADSTAESSVARGPILWRARYPNEIAKNLVSFKNPKGTTTNSDLELAAGLIQVDIAAHNYDICEHTITSGSDNTPTVSWQTKGSTTTTFWHRPTYYDCRRCINATTATNPALSLCPAGSIPWPTIAPDCGTSLTVHCLLILIANTRRQPGKLSTRDPRCLLP